MVAYILTHAHTDKRPSATQFGGWQAPVTSGRRGEITSRRLNGIIYILYTQIYNDINTGTETKTQTILERMVVSPAAVYVCFSEDVNWYIEFPRPCEKMYRISIRSFNLRATLARGRRTVRAFENAIWEWGLKVAYGCNLCGGFERDIRWRSAHWRKI